MCDLPRIVLGKPGWSHPNCYQCLGYPVVFQGDIISPLMNNFCIMKMTVHSNIKGR